MCRLPVGPPPGERASLNGGWQGGLLWLRMRVQVGMDLRGDGASAPDSC